MEWRKWRDALYELLFPGSHQCFFCWKEVEGQVVKGVCEDCEKKITALHKELFACPRCGHFTGGKECPNCYDWGDAPGRILSVVPYSGIYRDMVYSLKYGGREELADPLSYLMAQRYDASGLSKGVDLIMSVPLHPDREEERGYNQSAWLARRVAGWLGKRYDGENLVRLRYERAQTGLKREKRKENMVFAFGVAFPEKMRNKRIILIDDVTTTGATLNACMRVLYEAEAKEVIALTWAAGYEKIV